MTGQAALPAPVAQMTVESVVAAIVVALVVALIFVVGYAVVVGSVAWLLVLLVALLRLGWASLWIAGMRVRRRLHRTPRIATVGLTTGPPGTGLVPSSAWTAAAQEAWMRRPPAPAESPRRARSASAR